MSLNFPGIQSEEKNGASNGIVTAQIDSLSDQLNKQFNLFSLQHSKNNSDAKSFRIKTQSREIRTLKDQLKQLEYQANVGEYETKIENQNLQNDLNSYISSNKSKDRRITDLLEIINQYETQITSLNNQIISLNNSNKQMKDLIINIEANLKQAKLDYLSEKEANKNNELKLKTLVKEKEISQQKISDLINVINQYSDELNSLTVLLNKLKIENENLIKNKNTMQSEINEYKNNFENLENNYNLLKEENEKIVENDKKLRDDNQKLCGIQIKTDEKVKNIFSENEQMKIEFKKNELKYQNLIQNYNQDFQALALYIDTKFNNLLFNNNQDSNINDNNDTNETEPKLSLLFFQNCEDEDNHLKEINIELLIKSVLNGFNNSKEKIRELAYKNKIISEKFESNEKENKFKEKIINELNDKERDYQFKLKQYENKLKIKDDEIAQIKNNLNNIENNENNKKFEEKIDKLNNEIKIKDMQICNYTKLIKVRDENINELDANNKKLILDNVNLIKELKKFKFK